MLYNRLNISVDLAFTGMTVSCLVFVLFKALINKCKSCLTAIGDRYPLILIKSIVYFLTKIAVEHQIVPTSKQLSSQLYYLTTLIHAMFAVKHAVLSARKQSIVLLQPHLIGLAVLQQNSLHFDTHCLQYL